ncbi:TPA: PaaI family thioesterase [Burkholderia vietnamiensis]|nr:PaaI family thioesterase [Burkholderia vietnamiensis]
MKAIQDNYHAKFAHCYGCGPANPHGHKLKSYLVGDEVVARFTPAAMYSGGYPGNVYGGMIASLLDCHGTASAAAFAYRSLGRNMGDGLTSIRFVTASLKIDFKRPTPISTELVMVGTLRSLEGRKATITLTLSADGNTCALGEMLAVQIPDDHG